ncbi:MAG: hypothetical protein OET79_08675, partial [Nitrospirota bacterium]|nr:hypothetical protein [Nitrospirota bacterium]
SHSGRQHAPVSDEPKPCCRNRDASDSRPLILARHGQNERAIAAGGIAVFFGSTPVEAPVPHPSTRNFERDQLSRLNDVAVAALHSRPT